MAINIDNLLAITKLSLSEEQKREYQINLDEKMELIKESMVGVIPKTEALDISKLMPLREDVAKNPIGRELIRKNAPKIEAGCIVVPKLID